MDAQLVETTIKAYLTEIRERLDRAAGIGRAADACAGAGFHEKGLEVALDMDLVPPRQDQNFKHGSR